LSSEIDKSFNIFLVQIEKILVTQVAVKNSTKEQLKILDEIEEFHERHPDQTDLTKSYYNTWYKSIIDEREKPLGQIILSNAERKKAAFYHKNKQYLWLLVEAYEHFSLFLKEVYIQAGVIDSTLWPKADYAKAQELCGGNPAIDQLSKIIANKKGLSNHVLNQFRKVFPEVKKYDSDNIFGVNLKLALVLIGRMRHQVVHRAGIVSDKDYFLARVMQEAGVYNNGKFSDEHKSLVDLFMDSGEMKGLIRLLELPIKRQGGFVWESNIFKVLIGILPAYAELLLITLKSHEKALEGSM